MNSHFIKDCLSHETFVVIKPTAKIIWLGGNPVLITFKKHINNENIQMVSMIFHGKKKSFEVVLDETRSRWLVGFLEKASIYQSEILTFAEMKSDYERQFDNFELFWYSKPMDILRGNGLLVL
ncbi:MAG: hypothetical protein COZ08_04890 [Bacteroidetes bacterium CG_4_10_14_3_um_filter_42_6]|nr:MAG: hypothetical protein COZ08_04890 [Bacteroidetes bacterium CG_4_10_14_3_um_filter_42_6]